MAWTRNWATETATRFIRKADINDFVEALNERQEKVLGGGAPYGTYDVGDVATDGTLALPAKALGQFQDWVELSYGSFVVSHDAGVERGGDHWDGEDTKPSDDTYGALADVFSAAGLAHNNWRRYTTHPDEGGGVAYGNIQEGDIIGLWLFQDLYAVLNVLVWTADGIPSWSAEAEDNTRQGDNDWDVLWADAKTNAEADWPNLLSFDQYPEAGTGGFCSNITGQYNAELWRAYAYLKGTVHAGDLANAAEFYAYAEIEGADTRVFDANGDDVQEDVWSHWRTQNNAAGAPGDRDILSGAALGGTDKPTWCTAPPPAENSRRGYAVTDECVVWRWNVAGGLTQAV